MYMHVMWCIFIFIAFVYIYKNCKSFIFTGLVLSLRLLNGDLVQLQQESPLLFKNLAVTHKLGFSDVIMPGKHFILHCGEFHKILQLLHF